MTFEEKSCKCGNNYIENRTHWLCTDCNYIRLHGESRFEALNKKKQSKTNKIYTIKRKSVKSSKNTQIKRKEVLRKDREIYKKVFEKSTHECEECGKYIVDEFEDEEGNINAIFQYSHILSKGAKVEYRHEIWNFNILCLECHQKWENGNRYEMKIFPKNKEEIFKQTGKHLLS